MRNNTMVQQAKRKAARSAFGALIESNITLMLAVALVIAGVSMMFNPPPDGPRETQLAQNDPMALLAGGVPSTDGYADRLVAQLQERAKQRPDDSRTYAQLGVAYLQKSRETNDPAFYAQAESAVKGALELDSKN